jgi:hypothetical protein
MLAAVSQAGDAHSLGAGARPTISRLLRSASACTGLSRPVDEPAEFPPGLGDVIRLLCACGLEVTGLPQAPGRAWRCRSVSVSDRGMG